MIFLLLVYVLINFLRLRSYSVGIFASFGSFWTPAGGYEQPKDPLHRS